MRWGSWCLLPSVSRPRGGGGGGGGGGRRPGGWRAWTGRTVTGVVACDWAALTPPPVAAAAAVLARGACAHANPTHCLRKVRGKQGLGARDSGRPERHGPADCDGRRSAGRSRRGSSWEVAGRPRAWWSGRRWWLLRSAHVPRGCQPSVAGFHHIARPLTPPPSSAGRQLPRNQRSTASAGVWWHAPFVPTAFATPSLVVPASLGCLLRRMTLCSMLTTSGGALAVGRIGGAAASRAHG